MTKLTEEQEYIIGSNTQSLVVNAFAGTGKTTTLVEYAIAHPKESFMYLAFNRAIKEEAQRKFPRNVKCMTTHGLAYRDFGSKFQNKLGQPKPASVAKMLKCSFIVADAACRTLNNFFASTDMHLDYEQHLYVSGLTQQQADTAYKKSQIMWENMQDISNPYMRMPHDGYLKLYHMSSPRVWADVIMVDEAQDSNPIVLDIVSQQKARKIYIGDSHQGIYEWRKAIDALNMISADEKLYLTSSFRFGAGIASLATLLLRDWKKERHDIIGLGKNNTTFSVNENRPHAVLGRTNSGLFDAAVKALRSGHPFGYVGGHEGYRLDMIMDAWNLKKNMLSKVTDPTILLFQNYPELEAYAEQVDDKELKMLIRTLDKYQSDIPHLIEELKNKSQKTITGNEILLSTAHKSKGMEFDSVILLDDYSELKEGVDKHGQDSAPEVQDINILYVAITRAISNIRLNEKTVDWLNTIGMSHAVYNGQKIPNFEKAKPE